MKTFPVKINFLADLIIEIEAETPEEALAKAQTLLDKVEATQDRTRAIREHPTFALYPDENDKPSIVEDY